MTQVEWRGGSKRHLLIVLVASMLVLSAFSLPQRGALGSSSYSIVKTRSGLVARDRLNNAIQTKQQVLANTTYWSYYGTVYEKQTTFDIYKDSQGLHIGEPGPDHVTFGNDAYSGFYAVSPFTNAVLVHAVMAAPDQPVPDHNFQNQLEIFASGPNINYLSCYAMTDSSGRYWKLVHGYGDSVEARTFDLLWQDTGANQPITRECTLITNGGNYLRVYVDNVLVYSNSALSLNMPAPFQFYLITMNSFSGSATSPDGTRYGVFRDYYLTSDESIKVTTNSAPNVATVSLTDQSGTVLASSPVAAGSASLNIGGYRFPLTATINAYDSSGSLLTSSSASLYGGDVYDVDPAPISTTTTTTATTTTGTTTTTTAGTSTTTSTSTSSSTSATTTTAATTTTVTSTSTSPTTTTATTTATSTTTTATSTSSGGTSQLTVKTQDTNGAPLTGYYTELSQNGVTVANRFTPATYTLNSGQSYGLAVSGFGSCSFDHWLDGGNSNPRTVSITIDTTLTAVMNCGTTTSTTTTSTSTTTTTTATTSTSTASSTTTTATTTVTTTATTTATNTVTTTTTPSVSVPSRPTGLSAKAVSASEIDLTWTPPASDGGSPIIGYQIERSIDGGTNWTVIAANTGTTTTTYSSTGLSPLTTYTYRVNAINSVGMSNPSDTASAQTFALCVGICL